VIKLVLELLNRKQSSKLILNISFMYIRSRKKDSFVKKALSFRLLLAISTLILVCLSAGLGKEFYRGYQIQREIESLKKDIESFRKSNYELSKLIEYYKTDEYKEVQARERLNLKKDGEKIIVIKPILEDQEKEEVKKDVGAEKENAPNYKKWWNYFFGK